ncbi:MAG: hypothetical protein HDR83_07170 [Bacteroides sp.]|nr:hypothetical protein [Bacteroidales bacterium]MBD5249568.1 hypothetical protein [Barnesiella sp.]MBD5344612.1 hypothetical protein [Bacteroides sp.]MDE5829139.1 hypothetical protein [Duncaniella sp.]MBD5253129.1 hypothetical protein [Barnesiella sp.]
MKIKLSTLIPILLLLYLTVMSYIGYPELEHGHYLYYFGVIGVTLVIIFLLHIYLKKREDLREERQRRRRLREQ